MIYIGLQMPVMMQMHGLFIDIRLEGIIGIGQWRVLKWIMLMENSFFLLIYVSAGEIDEGGLKKIIACVIIIL